MIRVLDSLGLASFPVYSALYRPGSVATLVLSSGFPRPDGAAILYAPRRMFQPVGAPAPLPLASHYSYIQFRDNGPDLVRLPAVYFGPVFLGPWFYWHAERPSPEYEQLARLGLACLCDTRCHHEPPEYRDPDTLCFSFPNNLVPQRSLAVVERISNFAYSHGLGNSLCYTSPSGRVYHAYDAFSLADIADLRETDVEVIRTPSMVLRVYTPERKFVGAPFAILSLACFAGALMIAAAWFLCPLLIGSIPSAVERWDFPGDHACTGATDMVYSETSVVVCSTARRPEFDFGYYVHNTIVSLFAFGAIFSLVALYLGRRVSGTIDIIYEFYNHYARGAWPSTMRLGATPLGARLTDAISVHSEIRPSELRSMIRRIAHEMRYRHRIDPCEIDEWIRRNSSEPGSAPIPAIPVGHCVSCLQKRNLFHCLCLDCRNSMKAAILWSPIVPYEMMHVGMRPLYASLPILDCSKFRGWRHPDRPKPLFRGKPINSLNEVVALLEPLKRRPPTLHGRLCGPMFCGLEPTCFERGEEVLFCALAARMLVLPPRHSYMFVGRKGKQVLYTFEMEFSQLFSLFEYIFPQHSVLLTPWTREQVIEHQRNKEKREQLIRCYQSIDNGETPEKSSMVQVKPFVKSEKHFQTEYNTGEVTNKNKAVPRCINPVHPLLNAYLAPYTLPTSKHLNSVMNFESHVFYASGAKPEQINDWLNFACTHASCIIEDDVSMADGSHSCGSFNFQTKVLESLWGFALYNLPEIVKDLIHLMRHGHFRTNVIYAVASFVNLSGVPLTSWTNTIVFIIVRIVALAYGFKVIDQVMDYFRWRHQIAAMVDHIYMAVAGDDGVTFVPRRYNGVGVHEPEFLERYTAAWAFFGFDVPSSKIRVHLDHQWRLHTFLAMRPYWSGQRYEYGVEIARRMRSMFWQHDNNGHPIAWARGVAVSLLTASKHVPIVSDICKWYLHVTSGALNPNASFTNDFSTFYGYNVQGELTDRTVREFLVDYEIPQVDYEDFLQILWAHEDPLINLTHPVLDAIFMRE